MRNLLLSTILIFIAAVTCAQDGTVRITQVNSAIPVSQATDSVKLIVEGNNAYYQKTVKVDSGIKVSMIYINALQFMAAKNFQQNYGYQQEGKLIFTTTQDLDVNPVRISDDSDDIDPYTVQFAIIIDMKNGRYRYTIQNVLFFMPTANGNRRLTLYEMYQKVTNKDSRRIQKAARNVITSFERYITSLTDELYTNVEHKAVIFNPKF
jgi:hypothetical protein